MRKIEFFKTVSIAFVMLLSLTFFSANAQKTTVITNSEMEELQDQNMDYMEQIDKIIEDYPDFSYSYVMKDGKLADVEVTGVDNVIDMKKLEVVIFNLKSNKNLLKGEKNSIGVFYTVDKEARYKGGEDALENTIQDNLKYPEDAKNWGASGTIYVKFVIDANGNIPFASTSSNIKTSTPRYSKELEDQAVEAVKATSGKWIPGQIDGVNVASLAVVPIKFDLELDPSLSAWIE